MSADDPRTHVRDGAQAYERYLAQMDASMRQKIALTAAHLLCQGRVADMGMGSGSGSEALAALYPKLEVVGVDLDPQIVALAAQKYPRPNLRFIVGDIGEPVFPPESLDGIFDSSVLHHVTTFGGYERENAARALEAQARALKPHGVLVVRDFVDPGDGEVLLDLPADDGDSSDDPRRCSTAALFERFAREFRSLHPKPGCPHHREEPGPTLGPGRKRYRLSRTLAAEFVLRKDYRTDWESEIKEEYTYFTQARFESQFAMLGLRVLASTPLWNPWIVRNRFLGKFELRTAAGEPLEAPATNYVIVGERVPAGEGVSFREAGEAPPLGYLQLACYRDRRDGSVRDLIRRPNLTVDVLPFFEDRGDWYVLARTSYPRPILRSEPGRTPLLDGAKTVGYVTEPLNALQTDRPIGETVEAALESYAHIASEQIRGFWPGGTYYPSPGGIQEEVRSVLVEIEPVLVEERIANVSGFSTSGRVRAIEARQLLRAAQVGGLPDARLELNVYELLLSRGLELGPWIGEAISLQAATAPQQVQGLSALAGRPRRRVFEPTGREASSGFLSLSCAWFEELAADGRVLHRRALERVAPKSLSGNTVAVTVLRRVADEVLIGLDDDDLPAAQGFNGNSQILVAPAWRLPFAVKNKTELTRWIRERLSSDHGLVLGEAWELGGRYHPSAGLTPEVVYPLAVEVLDEQPRGRPLLWVSLREAISRRDALLDGHLRIGALRAAHALGIAPGLL